MGKKIPIPVFSKKILSLVIAFLLAFGFVFIPLETSQALPSQSEQASEEAIESTGQSMQERLSQLDGVAKVEKVDFAPSSNGFKEKFLLYFEQPFDWDNPEKGTFLQRVEVGFREKAEVNALHTNGYDINSFHLNFDIDPENITSLFNANYINVEHRFFGGSRPKGMKEDNSNFENWFPSFGMKQSAADLHKVYTEISKVVGKEKWISYGRSYSGLMTNAYAHYYPDDMACSLPMCAPLSKGIFDERFYKNIYERIGHDRNDGPEMRRIITDFQVELMRNKENLIPLYKKALKDSGGTYTEYATPERLFDIHVLEFAAQMWQVKENQTTNLGKDVKELFPEVMINSGTVKDVVDSEEVKKEKLKKQIEILTKVHQFEWATNTSFFPYFVSAYTETGQYRHNFQYLRDAMRAGDVSEEALSVTPEAEPTFVQSLLFTPAQKGAFAPKDSFYADISLGISHAKAKHLMLFGEDDPWTAVRIPINNGDNPNVKVYILPEGDHSVSINSFPEETKQEIIGQLKEWLGVDGDSGSKEEPADKVIYEVAKGAKSEWRLGSSNGLQFTITRTIEGKEADTYKHFSGATVDGIDIVAGTDYDAREGSLIITLRPGFLEKLSVGAHQLKVFFDDGREVAADFKVLPKQDASAKQGSSSASLKGKATSSASSTPKTGDPITAGLSIVALTVLVAGGMLLVVRRKQH